MLADSGYHEEFFLLPRLCLFAVFCKEDTTASGDRKKKPSKLNRRNKEGHYVLIKGKKIHQQDIAILNMHEPNTRTARFMEKTLL